MISLKNLSQYLASENLYKTDDFLKFSKINIKHLDESISCISWCGWAFDMHCFLTRGKIEGFPASPLKRPYVEHKTTSMILEYIFM